MKKDDSTEWVTRADAFKRAEKINRDELMAPSKWRLIQYVLSRPAAAFLAVRRAISRDSQQDSAGKKDKEAPDLTESKRTKLTRLLKYLQFWKKDKAGVDSGVSDNDV
jgi:hypothetical protein